MYEFVQPWLKEEHCNFRSDQQLTTNFTIKARPYCPVFLKVYRCDHSTNKKPAFEEDSELLALANTLDELNELYVFSEIKNKNFYQSIFTQRMESLERAIDEQSQHNENNFTIQRLKQRLMSIKEQYELNLMNFSL